LISLLTLIVFVVVACGGSAPAPDPEVGGSEAQPTASGEDMTQGDTQMDAPGEDEAMASEAAVETPDGDDGMDRDPAGASGNGASTNEGAETGLSGTDEAMAGATDLETPADDEPSSVSNNNESMVGGSEAAMPDKDSAMNGDAGAGSSGGGDGTAVGDNSTAAMASLPAWFSAEMIDINTGEPFTIAGIKDQVLLVETMAIWCSNCLRQQEEVKALHGALAGREGWSTVVLDIDPNERERDLQAYTDKHGFDWTYAIAPPEVAREIGQLYGAQFLNPPSTPMLLIDSRGEVHPLPFGIKEASELQEAIEALLDAQG
jgi:hypothetical protein